MDESVLRVEDIEKSFGRHAAADVLYQLQQGRLVRATVPAAEAKRGVV